MEHGDTTIEQYWIVITVTVNCQLIIDTVPRMNNKNILMTENFSIYGIH